MTDTKKKTPHKLTHFTEEGAAHMVGVSSKAESERTGIASGRVEMKPETAATIASGKIGKGDVLGLARIAGIQAAKQAANLIPLCHPIRITGVEVDLRVENHGVTIRAVVTAFDRTGVEMEALAAVSAAALTVYDMCKAIDRAMRITNIQLEEKAGGKSGRWVRLSR